MLPASAEAPAFPTAPARLRGHVDLRACGLISLPACVWSTFGMVSLDVSENGLRGIASPALPLATSLVSLSLAHNPLLTALPPTLALLPSLKYISLEGCVSLPFDVLRAYYSAPTANQGSPGEGTGGWGREAGPVLALLRQQGLVESLSSAALAPSAPAPAPAPAPFHAPAPPSDHEVPSGSFTAAHNSLSGMEPAAYATPAASAAIPHAPAPSSHFPPASVAPSAAPAAPPTAPEPANTSNQNESAPPDPDPDQVSVSADHVRAAAVKAHTGAFPASFLARAPSAPVPAPAPADPFAYAGGVPPPSLARAAARAFLHTSSIFSHAPPLSTSASGEVKPPSLSLSGTSDKTALSGTPGSSTSSSGSGSMRGIVTASGPASGAASGAAEALSTASAAVPFTPTVRVRAHGHADTGAAAALGHRSHGIFANTPAPPTPATVAGAEAAAVAARARAGTGIAEIMSPSKAAGKAGRLDFY